MPGLSLGDRSLVMGKTLRVDSLLLCIGYKLIEVVLVSGKDECLPRKVFWTCPTGRTL